MNVLITGITGFVGSHLADYILENHSEYQVHGLSRWRSPKENITHIFDRIHLHHGDLIDHVSLVKVLKKVKPRFVFHLAAQSYVPYSFDAPIATLQSNCIGTCNLLEAIKEVREIDNTFDPVIHICSSSEVYGQVTENDIPIKEDCPFRPASPYAVSKVCEDMLALQYWLSWKIKTIRTRMFTHSGPRRGDVFVLSNFCQQVARIEKGLQQPCLHVGNIDSVRTFADVRDTVRAYWMLVNKCDYGDAYNIGGNRTMTIREMISLVFSMSTIKNIEISIDSSRLRPSDVTLQIPCIDKFVNKTGWSPNIPFDKTVEDTLNFWRSRV